MTTKKKKDDKETAKAAVRARYLMEKYGMKWHSKVANGACWSFLTLSFISVKLFVVRIWSSWNVHILLAEFTGLCNVHLFPFDSFVFVFDKFAEICM